jgi:nucleotide-binding universal stress UspA family protein
VTFLVPYDGSYLAEAALTRATEYGDALDEDVTVVTVIPDDVSYAESKGWYEPAEDAPDFSTTYVAGKLHEQVTDIAPEVAFRYEETEVAAATTISNRIEDVADEILPYVVFLGTDNVGEIAEPLTSVAGGVAEGAEYDVHIVRYFSPTAIQEIETREDYPSRTT